MGVIKDWIQEMGSAWSGMAQGDANSFMGLPSTGSSNTGHQGGLPNTGHSNTGHQGGQPNTGNSGSSSLTAQQKQLLMQLFHQQYGRYPLTEFEYEQWLAANW